MEPTISIPNEQKLINSAKNRTNADQELLNNALDQNPDIKADQLKYDNAPVKEIKLKKGDRKKIQIIEQKFLQIYKELITANKKLSETSLQYQEVKQAYNNVRLYYEKTHQTLNDLCQKMDFIESHLNININELIEKKKQEQEEINKQKREELKEETIKVQSEVNITGT